MRLNASRTHSKNHLYIGQNKVVIFVLQSGRMKKYGLFFLVQLFALLIVAQPSKPNIIVFLIDDMGWQDCSLPFWNNRTPLNATYHTPNMERLAKKGMILTNAYSNSVCTPTRISLMTGMNVAQHGVTNWTSVNINTPYYHICRQVLRVSFTHFCRHLCRKTIHWNRYKHFSCLGHSHWICRNRIKAGTPNRFPRLYIECRIMQWTHYFILTFHTLRQRIAVLLM